MNTHVDQLKVTAWTQAQNDLADAWMKQGIALLEQGDPSDLKIAVLRFDKAIRLRSELPLAGNPWFRYCLAAGWMNRGDALTRLDPVKLLEEALHSYDKALKHLHSLPLDENPLFRERLAIACLNRGITLEIGGKFTEALGSFDEALALLDNEKAAAIPRQYQLLGCVLMNRGHVLLRLVKPDSLEAYSSLKSALHCLAQTERLDPIAAEASLKARHELCRSIANLVSEQSASNSVTKELVGEATDVVDEGMALAREWELRGTTCFRGLACELFRFGALAYQKYQPQFLIEFILESMDPQQSPGAVPTAEMHVEAVRSLWRAFRSLQREQVDRRNAIEFDRFLLSLSDLSFAENRLNTLRGLKISNL